MFKTACLVAFTTISGVVRDGNLGDWGTVPPKFEVGRTAHAFVPPNILRSSVVGCARKYEKSKKWCFSCEERVMYDIMTLNKVKIRKISENSKNLVDD